MKRDLSWAAAVLGTCALAFVVLHIMWTPKIVKETVEEVAPRIIQETLVKPPPMTFRNVTLAESIVMVRRPLAVSYIYDKRPECTPTLGTGRHHYIAWQDGEVDGYGFPMPPFKSADREPAGIGQTATAAVSTTELPPGNYSFQMISRFSCFGEHGESVARSDPVPFRVLPAS